LQTSRTAAFLTLESEAPKNLSTAAMIAASFSFVGFTGDNVGTTARAAAAPGAGAEAGALAGAAAAGFAAAAAVAAATGVAGGTELAAAAPVAALAAKSAAAGFPEGPGLAAAALVTVFAAKRLLKYISIIDFSNESFCICCWTAPSGSPTFSILSYLLESKFSMTMRLVL
jgi:hypothetical protein